jgi:hypothetical protein
MSKLLIIYYDLDPTGDIGIIGGSMSFLEDKTTVDDRMWVDWIKSLEFMLKHKNLKNYNHLTVLQAFLAMGIFLENYFGVSDLAKDIEFLVKNIKFAAEHKKVDQILWKNWLQCVDEVLSVQDSREYFYLLPKN